MGALIKALRAVLTLLPVSSSGSLEERVSRLERLIWALLLVELMAHHDDLSALFVGAAQAAGVIP